MEAVPVIHLDTHVVVWLFEKRLDRMPPPARTRCDDNELVVSPMVQLELSLMFEIGRITDPAGAIVADLSRRIGLRVADTRFSDIVFEAEAHSWTRDPFDRLIVATAAAAQAPLLTKDRHIRAHYPAAVWD